MEEYNDLEQVTGSPTAGENGYVHVETTDSASMDGGSINQDDGVVVTRVDTVQFEPSDVGMPEDGGNEEFVDCPDDLVSYDGGSSLVENTEAEIIPQGEHTFQDDREREFLPQPYQEERRELMTELTSLCHQLKALTKQRLLIDGNDGRLSSEQLILATEEGEEKSLLPLIETINECSKFVELALSVQSQTEDTIRELYATLNTKETEIEYLNMKVNEAASVESTADRILSSFAMVLGKEELPDMSVSGKLSHLEEIASRFIEKYNHFVSDVKMLSQCLAEVKPDSHMQIDLETVLFSVRDELIELKRKEFELAHKNSHLEDEYRKLIEHLDKGRKTVEMLKSENGRLKGEVELERTRYGNTKEKLNLAVTKGKSLVQQRDSLKQAIAEKTNELEKCFIELQSMKEETTRIETLANSLKEGLSQRDLVLEKCEEILSRTAVAEELQSLDIVDRFTWLANERNRLAVVSLEVHRLADALSSLELPEATEYPDLESQVSWLLESFNMAKAQSSKLQDEIVTMEEAARAEIDRLTESLLVEAQKKNYLQEEFEDLTHKYERIVEEKEQMVTLLLNASGISLSNLDDSISLRPNMAMVIDRCLSRIKEHAIASYESSLMKTEILEKIQDLLYERDQGCKLYEQILEEEKMDRWELEKRSNEIAKVSKELQALKDKNGSLQIDLKRSEEKTALLREKLSMAVKKGKGLIQERESMKLQIAEKNAQIEALKLELQQQEETTSDYRDQISRLSTDVERIVKLESVLLHSQEKRDQLEQFLVESNTMLQRLIEAIDGIALPVELTEPVEKVTWCATYLNESQFAKAQAEQELGQVKAEAGMLASKLTGALATMKSLEDALSVSEEKVSRLTNEKRELEISQTHIEQEVGDLKEEILNLNSRLSACKQELACKHDNWTLELSGFLENFQVLLKDETFLTLLKQSFEKKFESFIEMEHHIKDIMAFYDSKQLQDYPAIEESFQLSTLLPASLDNVSNTETTNGNATDAKNIGSYIVKTLENLNLRNHILANEFRCFSAFVDELIASLSRKLEAMKNSVQQNVNNLQMHKQAQENKVVILEHDIKVLLSACADVTKEIKFQVENGMPEIDPALLPEKLNYNLVNDEAVPDIEVASRNIRKLVEHYVDVKKNMSTTIEELQAELEKTRSMYDRAKEENDVLQNGNFKLETELEESRNLRDEMGIKLEDYQAKEDKWNRREAELAMESTMPIKDHEAENNLLSASEVKSVLNKINGITIPFPNRQVGDIEAQVPDPVKKLFYILDSVSELIGQITLLSHAKEELHSTLSKQAHELKHLKEEFKEAVKDKKDSENMKKELFELSRGLESIINKFGGDESVVGKAGLLPVLERLVQGIVLDGENSKIKAQELGVKLLETQKALDELANKVKQLEDFNRSRTSLPDTIHEKGVIEVSSLPTRSEITEIEDPGPSGKISTPLVPYAAHVRTVRKGSNDHLAINIDPESDRLIDKEETVKDKGHIFKSLHTSGLVPVQGKMIADRLDGIWVSGGRALMSRPRARLGLIAYWLVLHLWLMGTIL